MIKLLTFNGVYIPGYKAGGPIRSLANMAFYLRDYIEFNILTRDRDAGDTSPYKGIKLNKWVKLKYENVYYQPDKELSIFTLMEIINSNKYDIVLLNGVFSEYTKRYLLLRKLKLIKSIPTIIMPRGDLATGALSLKSKKKSMFLKLTKKIGMYKDLVWVTTSESEVEDVNRVFNSNQVVKISNLPDINEPKGCYTSRIKKKGELKIIYVSRITKVKNLHYALNVLNKVKGNVCFDIYGPISDREYWSNCKEKISRMKDNIKVNYHGSIPHEKVKIVMKKSDVFFLPTLGENYGHVIVEAISSGIPVIISDETPWNNLELKRIGWDIPLNNEAMFINAIQTLIDMDHKLYSEYIVNTKKYINNNMKVDKTIEAYKNLFKSISNL